ncbi:hypothetical protein [Leadbetterella byssophila]|uniref:hypothetical protein n=1 Tax=Leadbetterella byssophila TaxID=316068 RepID=UPI0039A2066F
MNLYHGISDVILALIGLYVFFRYLVPLEFTSTILWESFVLSVVAAATFGALGFFGWEKGASISQFFQGLAAINGGIGLIGGSAALVFNKDISTFGSFGIITVGFILFILYAIFNIEQIGFWVPTVSMLLVLLIGLVGMIRGKIMVGLWIVVGVTFFALGTFRNALFGESDFNISLYHLLLAGGVLSLGMANAYSRKLMLH